jgi:hypothetical protein
VTGVNQYSRPGAGLWKRLPKDRLQAIGEARIAIDRPEPEMESVTHPAPGEAPAKRTWLMAGALAFVAAAATLLLLPSSDAQRRVLRLPVIQASSEPAMVDSFEHDIAITPDGSRVVYLVNREGRKQLVSGSLDELDATVIADVEESPRGPFPSPDGNWAGYFAEGTAELRRASIQGGPPESVVQLGGGLRGASWAADDTIIASFGGALYRIDLEGGEPDPLTTPQPDERHFWPDALPGNEAVLFTLTRVDAQGAAGAPERSQIAVLSLETKEVARLNLTGSRPHYVSTGQLVYGRIGSLWAVAFDLATLTITSEPVEVLNGVVTNVGAWEDNKMTIRTPAG